MKHDKPLVEDEDYVVVEESPAYQYQRGANKDAIRKSLSAIGIYAPDISDAELFLCRECLQFTSTSVQGIHAHKASHKNAKKREQAVTATADQQLRLPVHAELSPDRRPIMCAELPRASDPVRD